MPETVKISTFLIGFRAVHTCVWTEYHLLNCLLPKSLFLLETKDSEIQSLNTELRNYTETVSKHYFYYTQFIKFILYRSGNSTKKRFQVIPGFWNAKWGHFLFWFLILPISRESDFETTKISAILTEISIFRLSFLAKIQDCHNLHRYVDFWI